MGLKLNSIKLVLESAADVEFTRTLTLGRQFIGGSPELFEKLKALYGGFGGSKYCLTTGDLQFAEAFFRMLGAKEVLSIDNSAYEGADVLHDLNAPIDTSLHQQFDAVFDTGTLEHVFNFPISIKNCMDMVKVGGHLVLFFPMNNFCGHGFYQFSPELFFRTLTAENGFEIERAIAFEDIENPRYYRVADPKYVPPRGKPVNRIPAEMFVQAKKIRHVTQLTTPQQSSYAQAWTGAQQPHAAIQTRGLAGQFRRAARGALPKVTNAIRSYQRKRRLAGTVLFQAPDFVYLGKLFDHLKPRS